MSQCGRYPDGHRPGLVTILALCAVIAIYPASIQAEDSNADDAVRLQKLRKGIDRLREVLKKTRSEKSEVQKELLRVEKSIGRTNRKLRQLRSDISQQKQALGGLYQERKQLRSSLSLHRQQLASQVRASYVMGRQEQIKIVLNQGDPSTVQRALVYFDYLNRSRTEQIQQVLAKLERLQQVEQEIHSEQQRLEGLLELQNRNRQKLLATREERKQILQSLSRDIISKDKQLATMLQDEKELQQILQAVESLGDIADSDLEGKPFAQRKGRLPWPANGRIREKFGSSRAAGGLRWTGVVIDAKAGQDVRAIARGRVAFADWLRGYGLLLIIDHGDGYMSLYGHNQSLFKEIGEWVEAGEQVATVGSSGGKSSSQLYFELRHKGKPVNPTRWCRRTRNGFVSLK